MSKSLMIVDDSDTMRKIIMRTLQTAGLDISETEEASNGNEALEKLNFITKPFTPEKFKEKLSPFMN